jgi:hypothetical protein
MPINVTPIPIPDGTLVDPKIREVVAKLQNGHAASVMGIKAMPLKEWLHGIKHEEAENVGVEGAGDQWKLFVSLIQANWEQSGTMPTQMSWMVIMLTIPKGGEITEVLVYSIPCGKS